VVIQKTNQNVGSNAGSSIGGSMEIDHQWHWCRANTIISTINYDDNYPILDVTTNNHAGDRNIVSLIDAEDSGSSTNSTGSYGDSSTTAIDLTVQRKKHLIKCCLMM